MIFQSQHNTLPWREYANTALSPKKPCTLFPFSSLMELFIINLITLGVHPKCNTIMGYNCSQDIKLYLGHGWLNKHLLIMSFSGLRSLLSQHIQGSNEFAAQMHISPVNGDREGKPVELLYIQTVLLSGVIIKPPPSVTDLAPFPSLISTRLKNSPGCESTSL